MEKVGDIIWDIAKYLCGCAKQEAGFICELEENLQSLKSKWEELEAKKKDVENELKKLSALKRGKRHMKSIFGSNVSTTFRSYKVGKKVAKMLTEVADLTTQGQRFGKDYQITHKPPCKGIGQIPVDKTVGQDLIFHQVWSSIEANNVGVIGLWGTGGIGKTNLLKKISNELGERKPDFLVIWVVVSKELNLDAIMDNIRKSVGIGDATWSSCNNQEEKSSKILGVLKQIKFALLLDDVWKGLDLNLVGVPHPEDSNFECKVLFTTRVEDVCEKMQAQESFKVDFLNEKKLWSYFI
ncbi:disease resistance protein SUMM2-like [Neltuma alba]|uniref:disease resistance protein SUMM2-like n=1 Tax=Neltuma alba TaxID=207710 RepID=UPI0010A35881|nr:disease resistance protein SUMM2-like [Prosopis alba]